MNLALIDPFQLAQDSPDALTNDLHSGHATTLRFNRKGDYLASGRADGKVIIWDMETNSVAMKLTGHFKQVQSLSVLLFAAAHPFKYFPGGPSAWFWETGLHVIFRCWSRCGRYLLTASQDWRAILWDLQTQERIRMVKFSAPVYTAELHPHNHHLFVVSLFEDRPLLVDITEAIPVKRRIPTTPLTEANIPKSESKQATTAAIFSVQGTHIITGTSKGYLNILETSTRKIIHSTKLSTGLISLLRVDTSGRHLLVNSTDRIIRVVQLPDLSRLFPSTIPLDAIPEDAEAETLAENITLPTLHKFQDLVNRLRWNDCAFSHSASTLDQTPDYVTASTYMKKDIYIWELRTNSLLRILENREEPAIIEWHPSRPLLAATSIETGSIQMWGIEPQQKWSALAPDFSEVTENVEYVEQEDEFDAYPEEELHKRRLDREDEDVDILNVVLGSTNGLEKGEAGLEEESFVLPMLFDIENSDDEDDLIRMGAGTMRKKEVNEGKEYALEDGEDGAGAVVGRTAPVAANGVGKRRK